MTFQEKFREWIEDEIKAIIEGSVSSYDNINLSVHNEFYLNTDADVDVTCIYMPSTNLCQNIYSMPIQLFVQANDKYVEDVYNVIYTMFEINNRTTKDFGEKYRVFMDSPTMPTKIADKGFDKYSAISMNVSLLTYESVIGVDYVGLKMYDANTTYCDVNVYPLNFATTFSASTTSTGVVGTLRPMTLLETGIEQTQISFVANNSLVKKLLEYIYNEYNNNVFIDMKLNYSDSTTKTINRMFITNVAYTQDANGYPIVSLTLMKGR